jgi:hypothetical protein
MAFAAARSEWHSYRILLRHRDVALHLAQCDRELKSHNQVIIPCHFFASNVSVLLNKRMLTEFLLGLFHSLRHAFATLSFIAETFLFLYVGMDALDIEKWEFASDRFIYACTFSHVVVRYLTLVYNFLFAKAEISLFPFSAPVNPSA